MVTFATALALGFIHTIVGPDHYLPFVVIGRARQWSLIRTLGITFICGVGHVASSVVLGMTGAAAGVALGQLQGWEEIRGGLAAWSLLVFGLGYTAYGLWHGYRRKTHRHFHLHPDGTTHAHGHIHGATDGHPPVHQHQHPSADDEVRAEPTPWKQLTPWLLFVVFILGPCEPLIPLFFAEAARSAWWEAMGIALGYGISTLVAMHLLVLVLWLGLGQIRLAPLERFGHALAGFIVFSAGAGMVFFGL